MVARTGRFPHITWKFELGSNLRWLFILCVAATWFAQMLSLQLRRGGRFFPQKRDAMVASFPRPVLILTACCCIGRTHPSFLVVLAACGRFRAFYVEGGTRGVSCEIQVLGFLLTNFSLSVLCLCVWVSDRASA
jgi:hypothetical protein